MTSVSSLGSSSASSYISSLDKNGDGVVSADELDAANTTSTSTSTSTTKSTTSTASADDDSASITQKIAADIAALMLQLQQSATSDDDSDDSSNGNSPKGILALMDSNSDGKLTTSEFLSADPATVAQTAGSDEDSPLEQVLTDMQTAIRAYQTTYGASAAAGTGSDDIQSI